MGYYARLKHGSKHIDLSSGTYELMPSFAPPAPSPVSLLSEGNMLNKYNGGRRIDRSFVDRALNMPLKITGDSASETHNAVRRLASFIENAMRDSSNPLEFVFGESDAVPYEPKWGQLFRYYEIKDATEAIRNLYGVATLRDSVVFLNVPMLVAPLSTGLRQRVGSATGGVLEHTFATQDGISRGLMIPPARTNRFTNPIFGHGTYDNGWTTSMTCSENTDEEFVFAGSSSAKLTRFDANTIMTQSLTLDAVEHYLSFYAKAPDGSALTTTEIACYYDGSEESSTVIYEGDGWYRVYASITGTAGATTCGMQIKLAGVTVYVDGFQVEQTAVSASPLAYGDLLDCSWSGTAHASTSARTAARYRIDADDCFDLAQGSISIVWKAPFDSTVIPDPSYMFIFDGTADLYLYWAGSNVWSLYDSTNAASADTTESAFSEGDIIHFVATWGTDGLALYIDGVEVGTNATYTPSDTFTYLYLGTSTSATSPVGGTFLDCTTWDRQLTATEVSNYYDNISEHITGGDTLGQRLNPIPWLWTDDGDNILDNYCDATHENYCIYGGIPGNIPADTMFNFDGITSGQTMFVSNFQWDDYVDLTECFSDLSGHVDATAVGGEVEQETVTTSVKSPGSSLSVFDQDHEKNALSGLPVRMMASISDAGSALQIYFSEAVGYSSVLSDKLLIAADATRKDFLTNDIVNVLAKSNRYSWVNNSSITYRFYLQRTTGSAVAEIDYTQLFLGDFFYVQNVDTNTDEYTIDGILAIEMVSGSQSVNNKIIGDPVYLVPNTLNHMVVMSGTIGSNTAISNTVTIAEVVVIPRWSIL